MNDERSSSNPSKYTPARSVFPFPILEENSVLIDSKSLLISSRLRESEVYRSLRYQDSLKSCFVEKAITDLQEVLDPSLIECVTPIAAIFPSYKISDRSFWTSHSVLSRNAVNLFELMPPIPKNVNSPALLSGSTILKERS